jgi:superfamily II DNA or RNA helicase
MSRTLTARGYSIAKDTISDEELGQLKKELKVSPYVPDDYAVMSKPVSFKLYRESATRMYIPKYYGIKRYGIPDINKLPESTNINLKFHGKLRDYQHVPVQKFLDAAKNQKQMGGILNVYCGYGKCLGKDTPVLMYDGSIKCVQDIRVGETLMGDDSTPRTVLSVCQGQETLYRVVPEQGDSYVVNESHILSLKHANTQEVFDISVSDFLKMSTMTQQLLLGYRVPIEFNESNTYDCSNAYDIGQHIGRDDIKAVPNEYKYSSQITRKSLLAGLFDTMQGCSIRTHNPFVFHDVVFIARSIGCIAIEHSTTGLYSATFHGKALRSVPVRSVHEIDDIQESDVLMTRIHLENMGIGDYYGFEIDGNRRFVLGDFTVTHNTTIAIHIMCELRKKTLVVCHKDFLLQQWRERIEQFAPGARIGLLKAKTIDVEDKDVVLASLQSLSMKDYDDTLLHDIGFVIVDECHHTGAEVFSQALKKLTCQYALGLSATIRRKDGLTKVFQWFLGDVVFAATKRQDTLRVKMYEYYDPNPAYSFEHTTYGNKPNVSCMINNICDYSPRLEFIVHKLKEILQEEPERKVIILSDRRKHLEMFHEILTKADYECAYYVGGMKQHELKESEGKQIILATFHIASEGFDCPGLDTLVLASPKSDVIQCVGRIQRTPEHLRKHVPLVLDIVDNFSLFNRQGKKRHTYYKSCKYDIEGDDIFKTGVHKDIQKLLTGKCLIVD